MLRSRLERSEGWAKRAGFRSSTRVSGALYREEVQQTYDHSPRSNQAIEILRVRPLSEHFVSLFDCNSGDDTNKVALVSIDPVYG